MAVAASRCVGSVPWVASAESGPDDASVSGGDPTVTKRGESASDGCLVDGNDLAGPSEQEELVHRPVRWVVLPTDTEVVVAAAESHTCLAECGGHLGMRSTWASASRGGAAGAGGETTFGVPEAPTDGRWRRLGQVWPSLLCAGPSSASVCGLFVRVGPPGGEDFAPGGGSKGATEWESEAYEAPGRWLRTLGRSRRMRPPRSTRSSGDKRRSSLREERQARALWVDASAATEAQSTLLNDLFAGASADWRDRPHPPPHATLLPHRAPHLPSSASAGVARRLVRVGCALPCAPRHCRLGGGRGLRVALCALACVCRSGWGAHRFHMNLSQHHICRSDERLLAC